MISVQLNDFFPQKRNNIVRDQRYHQAQNNDEFVVKSHLASLRLSDIIEIFAFVLLSLILYMLYYYRRECKDNEKMNQLIIKRKKVNIRRKCSFVLLTGNMVSISRKSFPLWTNDQVIN